MKKTARQLDAEIAVFINTRGIELKISESPDGPRPGFSITALEDGEKIGEILVRQHRWLPNKPYGVEHIYSKRLRAGIGTKLYQAAAREACRRGHPLMSDMDRSPEAEGFWRKQERKHRATRKNTTVIDKEVDYYELRCPAPDLD